MKMLSLVLPPWKWHRIAKDLFLHSAEIIAWLNIAQVKESELCPEDLIVTCRMWEHRADMKERKKVDYSMECTSKLTYMRDRNLHVSV
jgi:hypothetical protein